jgi:polyisoprenoid-binding protein YceI
VISVLNTETGALQFSLLNNAFHFPKAKMEDDFNEDYMESDKYPRSTFKGKIMNLNEVNFNKDGSYPVNVNGDLTIHGVTKNISTTGTITIKNGNVSATSSFKVLVRDYKIQIPSIVSNKIGESIEVKVACNYQKK